MGRGEDWLVVGSAENKAWARAELGKNIKYELHLGKGRVQKKKKISGIFHQGGGSVPDFPLRKKNMVLKD